MRLASAASAMAFEAREVRGVDHVYTEKLCRGRLVNASTCPEAPKLLPIARGSQLPPQSAR